MGRELNRVPMDFSWPLEKTWQGYLNPHYDGHCNNCPDCNGSGASPEANRLQSLWYGKIAFKPEDRGSEPFRPSDEPIQAFAQRNLSNAPDYYGTGDASLLREATRLCNLFNSQWSHHLNADDVAALMAGERLHDLTHTWDKETGWTKIEPPVVPTPQQVNNWSIRGMGHDSVNQWIVSSAECDRQGVPSTCATCDGEGSVWDSEDNKVRAEAWEREHPPKGDGYQIWETVSEGSPISPVFATPEELASWMESNPRGVDAGTTAAQWLKFIRGPGWAPSFIGTDSALVTGVQAIELSVESAAT